MALKITITGKVHNVGYRLLLLELADSLLIDRFDVRNVRINGKEAVVVLVDGDEDQLKEFVELVKEEKPENAVVEEIKVEEYKGRIRDIERFRASFNTAQLNKIVQVGLQMLQKQDETIKVIREESEKTREELKDEIRKAGEEIKSEVKEVSSKLDRTNDLLEKRFERLEQEIERIKKALTDAGIEI